jgi:hypothetical protein
VWLVNVPSWKPLGDFEVQIDARRGTLLAKRNLSRRAIGTAKVYDPNPVVENGSALGLIDARNRDYQQLTDLRRTVSLPNIFDGQSCLVGQWVDARRKRGKRVCAFNWDFSAVTRSSKSYEAIMSYFHIDRMQTYIQDLQLGAPIAQRPQVVFASAIGDDNSFYLPWRKRIVLGRGGVDDGEDADVIIHEYGHAIQDDQVPGFGRSFAAAAMGEGFGDYLAAVNTAELSQASPSAEDIACVFEWDAQSYGPPCGRRADWDAGLADVTNACARRIHCLGQVWSSALLELRQALGHDAFGSRMDAIVLWHHFLLSRSASFVDAAFALVEAADILYGSSTAATVQAEMVDRDLL